MERMHLPQALQLACVQQVEGCPCRQIPISRDQMHRVCYGATGLLSPEQARQRLLLLRGVRSEQPSEAAMGQSHPAEHNRLSSVQPASLCCIYKTADTLTMDR